MVKKYAELYLDARRDLRAIYAEQAGNMARQLLSAATGKTHEQVIADFTLYASQEATDTMAGFMERAMAGEPVAYILGQWDFAGMTLTVTRDTLIPRDDTMAVTELAIQAALSLPCEPRVLDLCTGTGCIGLAIAQRVRDARVVLGDVSQTALRVAKKNVQDQRLGGRVTCIAVDAMKEPSGFLGQYHLIVSNPPYVTRAEMEALPHEVKDYEPHIALYGGEDGLDFYRAIIHNFSKILLPQGYLCFEFGMGQGDSIEAMLCEKDYEIIERRQDMRNVLRAVLARKK